MRLVFVLPDDRELISGGNLYNRFLLEALGRSGIVPRAASVWEACRYLEEGMPAIFLVDSILLPRVPELAGSRTSAVQKLFIVVHLLPSLDPTQTSEAVVREREVLKEIDGFVVTSELAGELLSRAHPGRPVFAVPPAPVVISRGRSLPRNAFRGLMVGNVIEVKGVLALLRSLDALASHDDVFTIEIMGRRDFDPDYADACQRLVATSARLRETVRFTGPVSPYAMRDIYERNNVFISASAMETYGMALHEARTFGLLVLALDAGNVRSHVPSERHGRLFASVPNLARGCLELIRDQTKLDDLLRSAFEHRLDERYTWHDAAARLLDQFAVWAG